MAVKSCKTATKNVSDMGKELSRISQVSSVGALADQMAEAAQSKTEVETLLQERVCFCLLFLLLLLLFLEEFIDWIVVVCVRD